eukprot:scaffold97056_cov46-Cyclotella_meneghiniana.AAC.3
MAHTCSQNICLARYFRISEVARRRRGSNNNNIMKNIILFLLSDQLIVAFAVKKHASNTIHMFAENRYICLGYLKDLLSVRRTKRSMRHEKNIIDEVDSGRIKIFSAYGGAIMHRRAP